MSLLGKLRLLVAKFFGVTVNNLTEIQEKVLERAFFIDKEIDFILKGWIKFPPSDDHFTIVNTEGQATQHNIVIQNIIDAILMFVPRANDIDRISLTMLAVMIGSDVSSTAYIGKIPYDIRVEVIDGEWVSPFYQRLNS